MNVYQFVCAVPFLILGWMVSWDLNVIVPDHCLSFVFYKVYNFATFRSLHLLNSDFCTNDYH